MTNPTSLSPASLWHNSTTDRISFNEDSSEIIRIDQQGFHYKGQFIEDAGEAYRLLVEFLRKHQPDQQWGAEHNDTPLSPAAQAVMFAYAEHNGGIEAVLLYERQAIAATLRAAAERLGYDSVYDIVANDGEPNYRVDVSALLAIAAELEGSHD